MMAAMRAAGFLLATGWLGPLAALAAPAPDAALRDLEPVPLTRLTVRHWGETEGLPHPRVRALAQDREGYLWIGTDAGLVRFDGARFSSFTPANTDGALGTPQVRALLVDRQNRLWVGTHGEGALAVREHGRFRSLRGTADRRGSAIVSMLMDDGGALWFGSWGGVMHLTGGTGGLDNRWRSLGHEMGLPEVPTFGWAQTSDRAIWVGTWSGLWRITGARAAAISLPGVDLRVPVRALAAGADGTLWVGTVGVGLLQVTLGADGGPLSIARITDLPHDNIEALLVDRDGALWVGTRGGLARIINGRLEKYPLGSGWLGAPIESLLQDRDGQLWVGTATEGLLMLSSGPIASLTDADGLPRQATTAVAVTAAGQLWIGTHGDGLVQVDGARIIRHRAAGGLCTDSIASLLADADGTVWVGGMGDAATNLCRFSGGRFRSFGPEEGFASKHLVRALLRDRDGSLLVGSDVLYRGRGDRFLRVKLPIDDRDSQIFSLVRSVSGGVWVTTPPGVLHGKEGHFTRIGSWFATSLVDRGGDGLWLATLQGLAHIRADGTRVKGEVFGINDRPVTGLVDDGLGFLWVASPAGLSRLAFATADALTRGTASALGPSARRFGLVDGLPTNQFTDAENTTSAVRAPDGRLLFTTAKGVVLVDPRRITRSRPAPASVIEDVRVGNLLRGVHATSALPADSGDIEIAYAAPDPGHAERLRFVYRLEPLHHAWVDAGRRRTVTFAGLPPGRYKFRVAALNEEGQPGPEAAALALTIAPHWYQRGITRAAGAALLLLAALGWHRSRLRRVERKNQAVAAERTRIAREIHDSLTQELTGISLHLEAAHRRLGAVPDRVRANLDQARALVRVGLAEARSVVWGLRPEILRRMGLPRALAEIVRQMSAEVPVRLQVVGDDQAVPQAVETALLRVAQEAVTNALRHAKPSFVTVTLEFGPTEYQLGVRDDGAGFDPAHSATDRGLGGIRQRLAELGGSFQIESAAGFGTEVRVRIPRAPGPGAAS